MANGSCSKWWQARTNLEKTLMSFSIILLFTCVIIIFVGVAQHSTNFETEPEDGICDTKFCIETAGRIISMADFSIEPCADFYEFSCGQYAKKHAAPVEYPEASVAYESSDAVLLLLRNWLVSSSGDGVSVNRKAKTLFRTCMEYDQITEHPRSILEKVIAEQKIGTWPVFDNYYTFSDVKREQSLASLALLDIPITFEMKAVPDRQNAGKYVTKLSPGKPFYNSYEAHQLRKGPFYRYVESALRLLGVQETSTTSAADDILSSDSHIFQITNDADCKDSTEDTDILRLADITDLNAQVRLSVNWTELMLNIYSELSVSTSTKFPVDLYCIHQMRDFSSFFYAEDKGIYNYLGWRFLASIIQYLGPEFNKLRRNYMSHISKTDNFVVLPRWKECLNLVQKHMLPVLVSAYKDQELDDAILNKKMKMAAGLRSTLSTLFSSSAWLTEEDKQRIIQKVMDSRFEIPMLKNTPEIEELDKWFADLKLENNLLVTNVLSLKRFIVLKELMKLVSPTEESIVWDESPFMPSGRREYKNNRIAVQFDKLRSPYLSTGQQRYLNYGAFGTFLARELNNYLTTLDFVVNGTFWDFFLHSDSGNNCKNSNDFSDSNGKENLTMEEWRDMLTELNAIRTSYKIYKEQEDEDDGEDLLPGLDLTPDQLFFLSYAQTMCEVPKAYRNSRNELPARLRVNFALRNSDDFAAAYSCKKESKMNPPKKCKI